MYGMWYKYVCIHSYETRHRLFPTHPRRRGVPRYGPNRQRSAGRACDAAAHVGAKRPSRRGYCAAVHCRGRRPVDPEQQCSGERKFRRQRSNNEQSAARPGDADVIGRRAAWLGCKPRPHRRGQRGPCFPRRTHSGTKRNAAEPLRQSERYGNASQFSRLRLSIQRTGIGGIFDSFRSRTL